MDSVDATRRSHDGMWMPAGLDGLVARDEILLMIWLLAEEHEIVQMHELGMQIDWKRPERQLGSKQQKDGTNRCLR